MKNNIERIAQLAESWNIFIRDRPNKYFDAYNIKGYYYGDKELIEIYARNIEDNNDYDITLIHEVLHILYPKLSERNIEFSANQIQKTNKNYIKAIKYCFNLPEKIK